MTPLMRDHRRAYILNLKSEALGLQSRPNDEDVARFEALAEAFEHCQSTEAGIAEMERLQKEAFALRDEIAEHTKVVLEQERIANLPPPLPDGELTQRLALAEVGMVELAQGIDPVDLDLIDADTSLLTPAVESARTW